MDNVFYYLGREVFTTKEGGQIIRIIILDYKNYYIYNIYKKYTKELSSKLDNDFKLLSDITKYITFVIKRDGKISLDIK